LTDPGAPRTAKEALLDKAVEMLEQLGPDGFTVEDVLIESGTSSSSLYHHFGSRQGLLNAAREQSYRRLALREDRSNLDGGFAATTPDEFLAYLAAQLERTVTDPANRSVRRTRFEVAARALGSPELAAQTGQVLEQMYGVIVAVFDDAKARGLINPDLDTWAYALWFHGMVLGRTATESSSLTTEAWLAVAVPAALAPLRIPSS
jgi:AcrR family transcriptional regulator